MVLSEASFLTKLKQAQQLHQSAHLNQAKQLYLELRSSCDLKLDSLANYKVYLEAVLNGLVQICFHTQAFKEALEYLKQLASLFPEKLHYCESLASLYSQLNLPRQACECYQQFISAKPGVPNAYFNYAYNLKLIEEYEKSLENYQLALQYQVEQPEEVYLNMAVIYSDNLRQESQAKKALEKALSLNPEYTAAIYNLANLYEEEGDKHQASSLFQQVNQLQPDNYQALARLADVKSFTDADDVVIRQIQEALNLQNIEPSTRINLHFGLGKALDECGDYQQAFHHYTKANELNRHEMASYDKKRQEEIISNNIALFSKRWFENLTPISEASPVFICGMFRSGSTLTEQILASHPAITAGGEREFFPRLGSYKLTPYPEKVKCLSNAELTSMARDYLDELNQAFPQAQVITDKRPDNFLYLGLIKSLYPNAKIIHTTRNPLDNCLSVYFLRLGESMNYATDLDNTAHYYLQQERLMAHWKSLFPDTIYTISYDQIVAQPQLSIEKLLHFLELEWSEECLNFHLLKNRVKTASVWNVRRPLYKGSSGRWKNYQQYIDSLMLNFME